MSRCGRIMVGSGTDTYDPTCDLAAGHPGFCKSYGAVDQHRLARPYRGLPGPNVEPDERVDYDDRDYHDKEVGT